MIYLNLGTYETWREEIEHEIVAHTERALASALIVHFVDHLESRCGQMLWDVVTVPNHGAAIHGIDAERLAPQTTVSRRSVDQQELLEHQRVSAWSHGTKKAPYPKGAAKKRGLPAKVAIPAGAGLPQS